MLDLSERKNLAKKFSTTCHVVQARRLRGLLSNHIELKTEVSVTGQTFENKACVKVSSTLDTQK